MHNAAALRQDKAQCFISSKPSGQVNIMDPLGRPSRSLPKTPNPMPTPEQQHVKPADWVIALAFANSHVFLAVRG